MKRLLLTGALLASVFLCATAAQADDTVNNRILRVTVITKPPMKPHVEQHVYLPFETRFTCEEASDLLDLNVILKALKADRVTAACVAANSRI